MKRIIILFLMALPLLSQCQNSSRKLPAWVKNPPKSNGAFYAVGMGMSVSRDIAERKAIMDANIKLAEMVEPVVVTFTSRIDSVVRGNQVLVERVNVVRSKVIATLHNKNIVERETYQKKGNHTVYVLIELPKRDINSSFIQYIMDDDDLHSVLASTKLFESMQREIQEK